MSLKTTEIEECGSCGHLIARGRLTCGHCGAAAEKPVSTGNYNFYKTIGDYRLNDANSILDRLFKGSNLIDQFYAGNDINGEVHISDFIEFFKQITKRYGYSKFGATDEWKSTLQLFRIVVEIDLKNSIHRFIALLNGTLTICEVHSKAAAYITDQKWKFQKRRREEDAEILEKEIKELEHEIESKYTEWMELSAQIYKERKEFDSLSFFEKRKTSIDQSKIVKGKTLEADIEELNKDLRVKIRRRR